MDATGFDGMASLRMDRDRKGRLLAASLLACASACGASTGALAQQAPSTSALALAANADVDTTAATTATTTNAATTATAPAGNAATIDPQATASLGREPRLVTDPDFAGDAGRLNLRESTVDGLAKRTRLDDGSAPGIRVGSFILKPALSTSYNSETTRSGGTRRTRGYIETGLKGTLTSDWSRHELSITGDGIFQKNISGTGDEKPRRNIDARLRLDLSDDTTATLSAGYGFERESATDPNAVANALEQAGIDTYRLGAGITRDFGLIRGSLNASFDRKTYGSVALDNGTTLSLTDRDRNAATVTGRIGYELSPALIPFLEASVGRTLYDLRTDSLGYERSATSYAGRAGVQVDLGEKLRGEIGAGYETVRFDDARLAAIDAITFDGLMNWSPQRGTDVALRLATTVEPSTTAGQSGYVAYALSSEITHQLRDSVVARLAGGVIFRNYPSGSTASDERVLSAGAGLTWNLSRYLALTGDVSLERTTPAVGTSTDVARIGVGLTLRR
ncbi:outer membrane beta-barrel protein [Rhizobium sp. SG2393]|uniref:outer membrane beta-barrel protein n=1 Tax=Rhizobium sp. SG2393 TaxID=3276279 RepID=UPI00366E60DF